MLTLPQLCGAGGDEDVWNDDTLALCGDALASGTGAARLGSGVDGLLTQELYVSWRPAVSSL